jgi:hypothetical protein
MEHEKAQRLIAWIGRTGTRIAYVLLGLALIAVSVWVIHSEFNP